jgi:hypothetical protein
MSRLEIGTSNPAEAYEEVTSGACVTGQRVIIDGDEDKEVVILDSRAGASSTAPANSGIPSAMAQHAVFGEMRPLIETRMANHIQTCAQHLNP